MTIRSVSLSVLAICAGSAASAAVVTVNDAAGNIGNVDTDTGNVEILGETGLSGPNEEITDIAWDPNGVLYGISFDELYRFDLTQAGSDAVTIVGNHGMAGNLRNALAFSPDGTLYGATGRERGGGGRLYTIDTTDGMASPLGGDAYNSSGDLAFYEGDLYLGDIGTNTSDTLWRVDPTDGSGTLVGAFGVDRMYGLAPGASNLFGAAGSGIYDIDTATGLATLMAGYSGNGLGAAIGADIAPVSAAIPLPVPGALLLTGVGGLMALRRRGQPA